MEHEANERMLNRQLDYIRELQYESDYMYDDIQKYRLIIKRLLHDLQKTDNKECKDIYNNCIHTRTYRSFRWESSDEED
tara:strand:+ start:376 stop:612 length:237 start_codon:yes stop_codon:yes gene_type:complete